MILTIWALDLTLFLLLALYVATHVRPSTVQKWESPASGKHPGGAAAKLLLLIDKKGIDILAV